MFIPKSPKLISSVKSTQYFSCSWFMYYLKRVIVINITSYMSIVWLGIKTNYKTN